MKTIHKWTLLAALLMVFGLAAGQAQATIVTYDLSSIFEGKALPASTAPWLTATFDDGNSTGAVTLTLTSSLEDTSEFFSEIVFNVNPRINPSALTINYVSGTSATGISQGVNAEETDGSKGYDIKLSFATAATANRFDGTETAVFAISLAGLTANDFAYLNEGRGDSAHVAAHLQGITGGLSTHIKDTPVPIPAAAWLLGSGLFGLIGIKRRGGIFKK